MHKDNNVEGQHSVYDLCIVLFTYLLSRKEKLPNNHSILFYSYFIQGSS